MFYSRSMAGRSEQARERSRKPRSDSPEARRDRIIDVAIRLAEAGGFENVRQRDVAAQAGVALGTLYKSFRSKEDILSAALGRQTDRLEQRLLQSPITGSTPADRLSSLFEMLTAAMLRKPNYARAVLRAMTAGDEVAESVVAHQSKVTRMVITAMRGDGEGDIEPEELAVALLLEQIWFATLVGWSAGLTGQAAAVDQMRLAARLLVAGLAASRS